MAGTSTPKERIIPIKIEGRDDPEEEKAEKTNHVNKEKPEDNEEWSFTSTVRQSSVSKENGDDLGIKRVLPLSNCKEKIILVIDSAEDENVTPFKVNNNTNTQQPLCMLKKAAELFINSKSIINIHHEYALVILNENSAIWLVDFTNNVNEVINSLQNIGNCDAEDIFELNNLFEVIADHVKIPGESDVEETLMPPPYVVRTVLFYGRSYTVPELHSDKEVQKLLDSPYFTFDVLMTHEPVGINNNCNKIFNILQNIDKKGFAYFFPVSRDVKTLHESVGKLLAHPLQRPVQKLANYTLKI